MKAALWHARDNLLTRGRHRREAQAADTLKILVLPNGA